MNAKSEKASFGGRIIIVSNRLPFTATVKEDALVLEGSAGGLVSGLSAWLDTLRPAGPTSYTWVGWPGIDVQQQDRAELEAVAKEHFNAYPVYLSEEEMEHFYQGFCNTTIWPLFHYFPSYAAFHEAQWQIYGQVNRAFCDAVVQVYRPGDIIWVHDYHLMLLPKLLRERLAQAPIGFFLHIPFPSYEMLRLLPRDWRVQILTGLLGADLIGFHAHDYKDHFLRSVERFLGHERSGDSLVMSERFARTGAFPMGIDYARYAAAAESEAAQVEKAGLRQLLGDRKVILSIDRLDYTKGVLHRLQGYASFLEQNPEWHGKVVMALLLTPSRVGVLRYQETKQQIEALVGSINGRFGHMGWVPIRYQYKFVPFAQLAAMYSIGDVALVTPLRDGMNLVAKEYLASRGDGTGVLVLSVLAGAAEELREAVLVNPNSIEEIVAGIKTALQMPIDEQVHRNRVMQERLRSYDVTPWAQQFIRELRQTHGVQHQPASREQSASTSEAAGRPAVGDPRSSRRRVLVHQQGLLVPLAPSVPSVPLALKVPLPEGEEAAGHSEADDENTDNHR